MKVLSGIIGSIVLALTKASRGAVATIILTARQGVSNEIENGK
jgi:hypothetical protein